MSDAPRLDDTLFHRDPTRDLEEVQKVNATDQAQKDVEEFCETDSARRVLERLGDIMSRPARLHDPRFLYLHATFGSGKTHLLKLIGYAAGETGVPESVVSELSTRFEGFQHLRSAIGESPTDRFVPVFLNLLDRDASAEPPIPVLMYQAIGKRLGYPTDPLWLLEFLFQLEETAGDTAVWPRLQERRVDGRALLDDRGRMRTWLYEAVPPVMAEIGVSCGQGDVEAWIQRAEATVHDDAFGAKSLRDRVETVQSMLTRRQGTATELLIGLDEIALFIGDERTRYEELRDTMRALIDGPNPVVLGTGQWGLQTVHRDFVGDPDPDAWYSQEVELEGADTEVIVRRRWLQKKSPMKDTVRQALASMPDPPDALTNGSGSLEDGVEAYPLRPGDLHRIREAMQSLLTGGRGAATEHIQGRALLVLVRALFVRQGWAEKTLGAVVPWTDLFAVLQSETNLVPTWAEELLSRLEASAADLDASVQAVARTVFLLNQASVPATEAAITHLLLERVDEPVSERQAAVRQALGWLDDNNYVFEESDEEPPSYRLLTEQEVSVAEKVEEKADTISYPRLRSTIMEWLREYGSLLTSAGNRQEVDVGGERGVPLTFVYSVLDSIPDPSDHADTVALRVLVASKGGTDQVQAWKETNGKSQTLEDGLVVVDLPPNFERRLRRHVATGDVLQTETRHFPDLQSDHLREQQTLRSALRTALDEARVVDAQSDKSYGTYADGLDVFVAEEVVPRKFPKRRALTRPLQPIDDGPVLAAFFRGEADWPLSDADAQTLGIDRDAHDFTDDAWKQAFWSAAESRSSGRLLDGDQAVNMIEQRGGAFLGTSVEALQALLLALATNKDLQLRRDGSLLRDPAEMGRALRTKTQIRRLTIRLEEPPDRDAVERLRTVHRVLTGAATTPDDTGAIADDIATWAQGHVGDVQRVRQFVEQTFDDVSVGTLADRLQAAAADPASARAEAFSDPVVQREAEAFRAAYRLKLGDASELWTQFLETRDALSQSAPLEAVTRDVERATAEDSVPPTPDEIRSLLDRVETLREERTSGVGDSGQEEDYDTDDDEAPEPDLEDFTQRFGTEDTDTTKKRLKALLDQIGEAGEGRIVVIKNDPA
jgi:hypothetical protein